MQWWTVRCVVRDFLYCVILDDIGSYDSNFVSRFFF